MWKSTDDPMRVSTQQWKAFISSLDGLLGGPRELVFSGGEPLLRKDILELIRFGTDKGFKTLMPSNGYLIDGDMARRIADSGLKEIFISLDSVDHETHDFLRGVDGAHKRAMSAFDNLRKHCPGLKIGIITVISGRNYAEVAGVARWVKDTGFISGVYFQAVAKPFFATLGDDWYRQEPYALLWPGDTAKMLSAIDELIAMRKSGFPIHNFPLQLEIFKAYFQDPQKRARRSRCYAGDYVVNLNPAGDISLCCFMEPLGNISSDDIGELWFSQKAQGMRQRMRECDVNCNNMVNCFFKEDEEAG